MVIEPKNNLLVLNGKQGALQFYNPIADRYQMELQVTPPNPGTSFYYLNL